MNSRRPLTSRFGRIHRAAAVCLLLLIALPFTAPFATCDIADMPLHAGIDTDRLGAKKAGDQSVVVFFALTHADVFAAAPVRDETPRSRVAVPGPSLFALRL